MKKDVPKEWQLNRYNLLFNTITDLCHEHNAHLIIAGDLFEKSKPSLEEQRLAFVFFRSLKQAGIKCLLISGNHETLANGLDTFHYLDMGKDRTIDVHYAPVPWYWQLDSERTGFTFVNHCNLNDEANKGNVFPKGYRKILISHFRCNINQFIKEEVDVEKLLQPHDLCIAGDIHQKLQYGDKLYYTGQPINKEFEVKPDNGVILLTIDVAGYQLERINLELPALRKVVCTAAEYPPKMNDKDFYKVEVTGSITELRLVTETPNVKLDKIPLTDDTLASREVKEELQSLPLEEDLIVYMHELEFEEGRINRMVGVFK